LNKTHNKGFSVVYENGDGKEKMRMSAWQRRAARVAAFFAAASSFS